MRVFGLIGKTLSHSFSASYFNSKFKEKHIENVTYQNIELEKIEDVRAIIKTTKNLIGLNVTIPYKESIIPYLDEIDEVAKKVGAINTIHFKNGKSIGYNTDVIGFQKSLRPYLNNLHSKALIFGTGGSSKAICHVLRILHLPYTFVSRNPKNENEISYTDLTVPYIRNNRLLINCTPIGMHPNEDNILPIPLEGITKDHLVYDLIYNPEETILLRKAKASGAITLNGLAMLKFQAEASWNIWNS